MIMFDSPPSVSSSPRILPGQAGGADHQVDGVGDAPPHVVHHDLGVREVHRHLDLRLEQSVELLGDRDVDRRLPDERTDRLAQP
jgi:hypothetical protein